jgi:translation initiation factor IF-1
MKERHIKTLQEKYGIRSVKDKAYKMLERSNLEDRRDPNFFECLPYLGVFYIPDGKEYDKLIYCREQEDVYVESTDTELYKAKVIEVTENHFVYVHYDDHHHDVCVLSEKVHDWVLEGNIIKHK